MAVGWAETTKDDPGWEYVRIGGDDMGFYQQGFHREDFSKYDDITFQGDVIVYSKDWPCFREAPEADELRTLIQTWKDRGRTEIAGWIETYSDDYGDIWDLFQEKTGVTTHEEHRYDPRTTKIRYYKQSQP